MTGCMLVPDLRALARCMAVAVAVLAPSIAGAQVPFDVLHTFDDRRFDDPPSASIMAAANGDLYVTAAGGGSSGGTVFDQGMIFKTTPAGHVTMLHAFTGGADGATPFGALLQAADGNFYGTTSRGGANGLGTAFRMTPDGAITTLHAFGGPDGARPLAGVIQATDGNFYGTTLLGGSYGHGTVFTMTPDGTVTILHAFSWSQETGEVSCVGRPEAVLSEGGKQSESRSSFRPASATVATRTEYSAGTGAAHSRCSVQADTRLGGTRPGSRCLVMRKTVCGVLICFGANRLHCAPIACWS